MMPMMGPPPHGMMPGGPGEKPQRIPRLCCAALEVNVLEILQTKQLNEFKGPAGKTDVASKQPCIINYPKTSMDPLRTAYLALCLQRPAEKHPVLASC